ncbi:hypothetical protein L1887_22518 [Cichorium endivia]|nr:hypothetical protein L1887_22518 [Cichorium endivia]
MHLVVCESLTLDGLLEAVSSYGKGASIDTEGLAQNVGLGPVNSLSQTGLESLYGTALCTGRSRGLFVCFFRFQSGGLLVRFHFH